jgi:hypothetical protein
MMMEAEQISILLIDNDSADQRLFSEMLQMHRGVEVKLIWADNLATGSWRPSTRSISGRRGCRS